MQIEIIKGRSSTWYENKERHVLTCDSMVPNLFCNDGSFYCVRYGDNKLGLVHMEDAILFDRPDCDSCIHMDGLLEEEPCISCVNGLGYKNNYYVDTHWVNKETKKNTDLDSIEFVCDNIQAVAISGESPFDCLKNIVHLYDMGVIEGKIDEEYGVKFRFCMNEDNNKWEATLYAGLS